MAARPAPAVVSIATWARRDESALFAVPLAATWLPWAATTAASPTTRAHSPCPTPQITAVLEPAGWTDLRTEIHHLDMTFGGGLDPAAAAPATLDVGPTRIATADIDDKTRAEVVAAIADALAHHVDAQGHVVLSGTVLITTAKRPTSLSALLP